MSTPALTFVLVLEDEPFIAMDLQFALEDVGITAVTAKSSEEAFAALENNTIDGGILDVNLGKGMTCEPVALELHRRGVPFILNTGDLDRSGELLRRFDAPVVAKPTPAEMVVDRLLAFAAGRYPR
ncbi:response regulator [Erythrobacter arachoides]|uniref:Response regulator n=1 Tax=Aurantiacibacter arachoides TaxID=1850444 RepID=A0A845A1Y2_9SPHN|nr:response regulator [Aurantiacibacter arachoides]MXO92967.1 response regulator [Aurantiacibacter arachoides]GGD53095.1 hypothetical protein GCM10011411_11180 [Aurantiacibacter arachoides]